MSPSERTEYELERALDDALHRHQFRLPQLRDALPRAGRSRKGANVLAAILSDREQGSGISRFGAEIALRRLLRAAELAQPDLNVRFARYEPDMVWLRSTTAGLSVSWILSG